MGEGPVLVLSTHEVHVGGYWVRNAATIRHQQRPIDHPPRRSRRVPGRGERGPGACFGRRTRTGFPSSPSVRVNLPAWRGGLVPLLGRDRSAGEAVVGVWDDGIARFDPSASPRTA